MAEKQRVTREFEFKLTERDTVKLGKEQSKLLLEIETIREEAKRAAAEFKLKIDERLDRAMEVAKTIELGKETRIVTAEFEKDYPTATKRYFFEGKKIHEEAMTADELQMSIDDVKPNSPEDLGYKKRKKTAADGRLEDSQKAIASKKRGRPRTADVVKLETSRKTKRSVVDSVYAD